MKRKVKGSLWQAAGLLFAILVVTHPARSQSLTWLGTLGGSTSIAFDVSSDGRVVVGRADNTNGQQRAFRWELKTGMQDLGAGEARGVSADGNVVVGTSGGGAFVWRNGVMQSLGTLGGGGSSANDVSADGDVVVGWAGTRSGSMHAFRWTATSGMQDLGTLGGETSQAIAVSRDGQVVVGYARPSEGLWRAFRWTAASGMQDLGTLGGEVSVATAASNGGQVVVGWSHDAEDRWRAFRWSAASGMQDIGALREDSWARDVSADGNVIVGRTGDTESRAFRWTPTGGMEDLNQTYANLLPSGSILQCAEGISPDGRYIVGYGYNASKGRVEGFLLDTGPPTPPHKLTWLGSLRGGPSEAWDVSADGSVVVGISDGRAFRWTAVSGMQDLGTMGGDQSVAAAVSWDGNVVVGWANNAVGQRRAFLWTIASGMQELGTFGGGSSEAWDVSADGSVVVGTADLNMGWHAFRWTSMSGMQDIGVLWGTSVSIARGVSADGSAVVGSSGMSAFRWTQLSGMRHIADASIAVAVSADGKTVVGTRVDGFSNPRAFRWRDGMGLQILGALGEESSASDVSADGSVVVGRTGDYGAWRAFRWTPAGGMEDLNQTYANLLPSGSILESALGISPDGRYIVGYGFNSMVGRTEAFLLDTSTTIKGAAELCDFVGDITQVPITVELRRGGLLVRTENVRLDASGKLRIPGVMPGIYDVAFKASHWLRVVVRDVVVSTNDLEGLGVLLVNGDVDEDNEVSVFDFGALVAAFGSVSGGANWNPNADLDGDEEVSTYDFGILIRNFGLIGDE